MRNDRRIQWLLVTVAMVFMPAAGWPQTTPQTDPHHLMAAGSGVNLGITQLLAEAFMRLHPETTVEVPGSIGSRGAISAVADGAITLGLISRPLKSSEESPGLVTRPYARTAIVVGVHPAVKEEEITLRELVDIYRGTKTRWKDASEIIVLAREPGDSGMQVMEEKVPGFKEAYAESAREKRWTIFYTDQDANRALATTRGAIGVSDLGMISAERLDIKVLKLNGITPALESLLDERYPLSRDLAFLYREGTLPEEARAFLDFVYSGEGGRILRSSGYLPLR